MKNIFGKLIITEQKVDLRRVNFVLEQYLLEVFRDVEFVSFPVGIVSTGKERDSPGTCMVFHHRELPCSQHKSETWKNIVTTRRTC